jgi:cysteine desulfurase/selenocysteine lyase
MIHALDLLDELGVDRIEAHLARIGEPVREWARRRGVRTMSPDGRQGSGMVCLAAADVPRGLAALSEAGVVTGVREGSLRLSPHCYNTVEEMERVAAILDQVR